MVYGAKKKRHVLIDFGTTGLPQNVARTQLRTVAQDIARQCNGKLDGGEPLVFTTQTLSDGSFVFDSAPELTDDDFVTLNAGAPAREANQALIAAGTGLGEAILFWDGARHVPSASEGGHP